MSLGPLIPRTCILSLVYSIDQIGPTPPTSIERAWTVAGLPIFGQADTAILLTNFGIVVRTVRPSTVYIWIVVIPVESIGGRSGSRVPRKAGSGGYGTIRSTRCGRFGRGANAITTDWTDSGSGIGRVRSSGGRFHASEFQITDFTKVSGAAITVPGRVDATSRDGIARVLGAADAIVANVLIRWAERIADLIAVGGIGLEHGFKVARG